LYDSIAAKMWILCSWKGDYKSGVALAMHYRRSVYQPISSVILEREMSTLPMPSRNMIHFIFALSVYIMTFIVLPCFLKKPYLHP